MVLDAVSNFVRGNTDAEVGSEDTTVSVADASIFPDPSTDGEFNVVIWDVNNFPRPDQDGDVEILRVTERDTTDDELTVTRGQELTSAASHPEGSAIHLSPTAKMFSDIESTFGDFWNPEGGENGQLTADVNNTNTTTQALEADDGIIGSPTGQDVLRSPLAYENSEGRLGGTLVYQDVTGLGTDETAILPYGSGINDLSGGGQGVWTVRVFGRDGGDRFSEIIHSAEAIIGLDIISTITDGSPPGRTYSHNDESDLTLQLDSALDQDAVTVVATGATRTL